MASSGSTQGQVTVGEGNTNQASAPMSSNTGAIDVVYQGKIRTAAVTPIALPVSNIGKVRLLWIRSKDSASGADKRMGITVNAVALPPATEYLFTNADANATINITTVTITPLDTTATLVDFIIAGVT